MADDPLFGIIPSAVGPYVACIARPDGTTVVASGASEAWALHALLMELQAHEDDGEES